MKDQACQPCAKRKVRCDREEPCSNCKRRKQDQCTYSDISPTDRIKQLEALVKNLQNDSKHGFLSNNKQTGDTVASGSPQTQPPHRQTSGDIQLQNSTNPLIVKENGDTVYLESCVRPSFISAIRRLMMQVVMAQLVRQELRVRFS